MTTYSICVLSQRNYTARNSGICSGFYLSGSVCSYFEPKYPTPCSWPMNHLKFKRPVAYKLAHFNALIPFSLAPLSHLFQLEDIAARGIFLTVLLSILSFSLALLFSHLIPCPHGFLSFTRGLCVPDLSLPFLSYSLRWNGRGGWQGGCFGAGDQWGCKSSSHLLSSRRCLQRTCLEMTARGPDPPAICTCSALVRWCLCKSSWGQEGKGARRREGARRRGPWFARILWGSLKTAACFQITPLPSSAAFSLGCIFKQGRPGVTKLQLSPSLPLNKPNKLAYWVYL